MNDHYPYSTNMINNNNININTNNNSKLISINHWTKGINQLPNNIAVASTNTATSLSSSTSNLFPATSRFHLTVDVLASPSLLHKQHAMYPCLKPQTNATPSSMMVPYKLSYPLQQQSHVPFPSLPLINHFNEYVNKPTTTISLPLTIDGFNNQREVPIVYPGDTSHVHYMYTHPVSTPSPCALKAMYQPSILNNNTNNINQQILLKDKYDNGHEEKYPLSQHNTPCDISYQYVPTDNPVDKIQECKNSGSLHSTQKRKRPRQPPLNLTASQMTSIYGDIKQFASSVKKEEFSNIKANDKSLHKDINDDYHGNNHTSNNTNDNDDDDDNDNSDDDNDSDGYKDDISDIADVDETRTHKRIKWSLQDDLKLLDMQRIHGNRWKKIADLMGEGKCLQDVQVRYRSLMRAQRREWSIEEDKLVYNLRIKLGNNWDEIVPHFKGRSKHALKNRFRELSRKNTIAFYDSLKEIDPKDFDDGAANQVFRYFKFSKLVSNNKDTKSIQQQ